MKNKKKHTWNINLFLVNVCKCYKKKKNLKGARISAVGNTSLWGRVKKKENYMLFKYNLNLKIENDVH